MQAPTVAALYVDPRGAYSGLPGVECWGLPERDAREYAGPHPVVAHPPCERWGRYWFGGPNAGRVRKTLGDDAGCFASALSAVRAFGGVLEHPEASHAWRRFRLVAPPRHGGWIAADRFDGFTGWTCCVEQGAYGHRARKATWLYACGVELPSLRWGFTPGEFARLDDGFHSNAQRANAVANGWRPERGGRLTKTERAATPPEFRDVLLSMARTAGKSVAA
jgi:hypothetical protein